MHGQTSYQLSAIKSASKFTSCETSTDKNNIDIITVNIKYVIFSIENAPQTQSVGFLVAFTGNEGKRTGHPGRKILYNDAASFSGRLTSLVEKSSEDLRWRYSEYF